MERNRIKREPIDIKIITVIQLIGDRGFLIKGKVVKHTFEAHLQPIGWFPKSWQAYNIKLHEIPDKVYVETFKIIKHQIEEYLNKNQKPPQVTEMEKMKGGA